MARMPSQLWVDNKHKKFTTHAEANENVACSKNAASIMKWCLQIVQNQIFQIVMSINFDKILLDVYIKMICKKNLQQR